MKGDLAFMPRWNLLVLPWCQWQSAVPSVVLSPDPNRDISGSCRDCARAIGYTSWSLRPASQIQVKDNRKIPFGSILSLWPELEILFESLPVEAFYYMWWEKWKLLFSPPFFKGFQGGANGEEPAGQRRRHKRWGLIPGSGRSPGVGKANLLQYSCLESPMDRGAWWTTVHGATKSWTRLSARIYLAALVSAEAHRIFVAAWGPLAVARGI